MPIEYGEVLISFAGMQRSKIKNNGIMLLKKVLTEPFFIPGNGTRL